MKPRTRSEYFSTFINVSVSLPARLRGAGSVEVTGPFS
jgi:hypothetical protein